MIETSVITGEGRAQQPLPTSVTPAKTSIRQQLAGGAVLLLSIFVNFYNLGQHGFGNLYYAAGVRSMIDNFHNFFFVSYDPGGVVTLDKPPLGFWLEALSARIFGFTPFSVLLPQALAGVLAVPLLYVLVRRRFGFTAGLLAALALAVSPLSVVTSRNETIDSTLVLFMLLGAWAILRAAEHGKWRWLLLSAVLIGLGFNVKTLEAYLVLPAFGVLYLLAAPRSIWVRIGQLAIALLVLLVVSLSWLIAVDLTPSAQRPYVGSSQNNSELNLVFGYNGAQRLAGPGTATNNFPGDGIVTIPGTHKTINIAAMIREWCNRSDIGCAGPFRLFSKSLGGQVAWLLPFALFALLALAWQRRWHIRDDFQQQSLLLWGIWLFTMSFVFSIAAVFHQYYMVVLMPAVCALFGIGTVIMWQDYRRGNWRGWLLPLSLLLTATGQISIITADPAWGSWLTPAIVILTALVVLFLVVHRLLPRISFLSARFLHMVFGLGVAVLLLTPAIWSVLPALQETATNVPTAGPNHASIYTNRRGSDTVDAKLVRYLEANQGEATYLVATASSIDADGFILATNKPVMAMGGFDDNHADPILTPAKLQTLITNHTVRFFFLNGGSSQNGKDMPFGSAFSFGGTLSQLTSWVTQSCRLVPLSDWSSSTNTISLGDGSEGAMQLYDCAPRS